MNAFYSPIPVVSGPHAGTQRGVPRIMAHVILALLPATLFGVYLFGWPALNLILVAIAAALASEAAALRIAGKPIRTALRDGSAPLTALLLALSLPPWAPWWIAVLGGVFAIVIGKQIFGGIGQNVFNPAMLARVALLISFPVEMTFWVAPHPLMSPGSPDFIEGLRITFIGVPHFDSMSSASLLGHLKTELGQGMDVAGALAGHYQWTDASLGFMAGSLGETSAFLILAGGVYLLIKRIITWHVPTAMLGAIAVMATLTHFIDPSRYPDAAYHVLTGGVMLGAFFIATDLVTSPSTPFGQLLFGAGCGLLVWIIRTFGGYPEGVAFAVLIMNAFTPLIDHWVRPRIYGRTRRGAPRVYTEEKKP